MHILYVTLGYKPAYKLGGPIWSVAAIAERMAARGHKVTVFATNSNYDRDLDVPVDTPVTVNGVEVWYFKQINWMRNRLGWLPYLSKSVGFLYTPALRETMLGLLPSIDIVHTQMPFIYPTLAAGRLAIKNGVPLFYNARGSLHPRLLARRGLKKKTYISLFERRLLRGASGLIALTERELDDYRTFSPRAPLHLVPNGVEIDGHPALPAQGILDELKIGKQNLLILFLGRLHPKKGANIAIEAFLSVADRFPDAILVMAGPDEHHTQATMAATAQAAGLQSRIRFPGLVTGEAKRSLLASADLFLLPSEGEGMPMAVLEALANRTPVLISEQCNMPEIQEAGAGRVIPRSAQEFSAALAYYLGAPDARVEASNNAFQLACTRYSWDPIVKKLEDIYRASLSYPSVENRS